MLKAWEGEMPKPTREAGWAPWIKLAIQRVMTYNVSFVKERDCFKGMQIKAHSKKI